VTETSVWRSVDPQAWAVHPSWSAWVNAFWQSSQGQGLLAFLQQRLQAGACIYPPQPLSALLLTPLGDVKVVILGQDPYHGAGQAEGLAFSVPAGVATPPSLRNIFKELHNDLGQAPPFDTSLIPWARKGVLLLNTCLSVEDGQPGSHAKQGWEALTDKIIQVIAESTSSTVFMLWGAHAQSKAALIAQAASPVANTCLVLQANHPSPLSALRGPQPFIGCRHFSLAQQWLQTKGVSHDWRLES
jgi:uracil-DNA glycosylase